MDIEGVALRVFRAAGYSLAAAAGLFLVGAGFNVIIAIAAVVAFLQILNVLTYWASIGSALLLVWGGLTAAGITPGVHSIGPLQSRIVELGNAARSQAENATNVPAPQTSLQGKLEDLKAACDKKALSPAECDATRSKILADFTK